MLFLQILGWVLLSLFGLIVVLTLIMLFTPFKVAVVYPQLLVVCKFGPVKYTVYPLRKKAKKPKKNKDKKKNTAQKTSNTNQAKKTEQNTQKHKKTQTQSTAKKPNKLMGDMNIKRILSIVQEALPQVGKAFRKLTFDKLCMSIVVADNDRAKCAEYYGVLCAVVPQVVESLRSTFTLKHTDIEINCDMAGVTPSFACDIIASVRAVDMVVPAFAVLIKILKKEV